MFNTEDFPISRSEFVERAFELVTKYKEYDFMLPSSKNENTFLMHLSAMLFDKSGLQDKDFCVMIRDMFEKYYLNVIQDQMLEDGTIPHESAASQAGVRSSGEI